ncbi:SulP family inorganic anion transporter [Microbacterium sp. TNHR37B]|uniref:SulP family inorganic anion transporter n=1 Tax=Microbacterium sp. TNHR37B TaxID=1775956 RepID=UPI0007B2109E|nr:SulP family inorganic anion transporter [Microbacterium sp. TNHR37B]KZE91017.1 C4-dicarboxylic acid transporter DauA [Microbacterium sp. TNHR37B]
MTVSTPIAIVGRSSRRARLRSLLPSRADYTVARRSWRSDLTAGVTVGIVALPLALGFGVSSGLTAEAGLVTAVIAGALAAFFGGSHVQVSGPTGAMVVVLLPIVAAHGAPSVVVVTLIAGVLLVAGGLFGLGRAVSFIPWPVIEGFTLGIATIIFLQQVPLLLSPHIATAGQHSTNAAIAAVEAATTADPDYLLWSGGVVAVVAGCMVLAPRVHRAIPGSLVGIVVTTAIVAAAPTPLATIGPLPATLPLPTLPEIDPGSLAPLLLPAVTVAVLAAIESLLSARVAASMADTGPYDPDRELVGQGIASIGSGLFGGMPATGAIARTAVNVKSGGRSRLASLTHAAVLLVVVFALAGPVGRIPLPALAAVLMVTAVRMVHVSTVRIILRSTRSDAAAFILTALITVAFDLIVAVGIGVLVAGLFALRSLARRAGVQRETIQGDAVAGDERIAIIRFDGPLFFAASDRVFEKVNEVRDVSVVILRMSQVELVDATGARILEEIVQTLERRGVTVLIKGVQPRHDRLFRRIGVLDALRDHRHLFLSLPDAIAHARDHVRRESASA